jgi:hypothetical protein
MNRFNITGFRCQPERSRRDMEKARGFAEVEPRFDSVAGGFVDGNAVMRAQRGDTLARPAIAVRPTKEKSPDRDRDLKV